MREILIIIIKTRKNSLKKFSMTGWKNLFEFFNENLIRGKLVVIRAADGKCDLSNFRHKLL